MRKFLAVFIAVCMVGALLTGGFVSAPSARAAAPYTVTFDSQGGTPTSTPITGIAEGGTVGTLPDAPVLTGSTFNGWLNAITGGTAFTATTPVTADITVYAQWTVDTYAVTLGTITKVGGDDESTITIATSPAIAGATVTLTVVPKAGMQLVPGTLVATDTNGGVATLAGTGPGYTFTMPAYAVAVTATFEEIPGYAVTFTVTDGTAPIVGAQVTINGTPVTTDGSGAAIFSNLTDGTYAYSVTATGYADGAGSVTVAGGAIAVPVIMTATIAPTTYTVTFDSQSGTPTPAPITGIASGATVTLPAAPTLAGSTFNGWFDAITGGTAFTATTPVTADITVYAQWTGDALTRIGTAVDAVDLGKVGDYIIFAEAHDAGITSTGVTTITGDLGTTAPATTMTGFGLIMDSSNTFSKTGLNPATTVVGNIYAYDYTVPTPAKMTKAAGDLMTAYTYAKGQATTSAAFLNVGTGTVSAQTLVPGVYTWGSNVSITGDIILDGTGVTNPVWIFQISGTLDVMDGVHMSLAGGANAANIFWAVSGATSLLPGATFEGNILAATNIATAGGNTVDGRLLAQTAVTLVSTTVGLAGYIAPPAPTGTITIIEVTNPNGPQDFSFTTTGGLLPATFSLDNDADPGLSNTQGFSGLAAGTYTITEAPAGGYTLVSIGGATSADLGLRTATITLLAGGEVTVTFTNNIIPASPVVTPPVVIPPVVIPPVTTTVYHQTFFIGYPDGMFKPDRNVSRAEVAAALTRALGLGWSSIAPAYPDVSATHWATGDIQIMKDEGIMIGDTGGTFRPDAPITRAEAAAVFLRLLKIAPIQNLPFSAFPDVPVTYWAAGYIAAMQLNGYITGYPDGTYKPTANILRSEFTAIASRALGRVIGTTSKITGLTGGVLWPDVPATYWAYTYILEASTPHTVTNAVRISRNIVLSAKTIPLYEDNASVVTIYKAGDVLNAIVPVDGLLPNGTAPAARKVAVVITIKLKP